MDDFDIARYLERVGLTRVPASAAGLAALQSAQLRAVPFENVDAFLGGVPDLEAEAMFRKLVRDGRGGYCFELNALLGGAMAALGIPARRILARVRRGERIGARTHLAWIAEVEGRRFLADAGFGGPGALEPLELKVGEEQPRSNGLYRLGCDAITRETVVERHGGEGWTALFAFDEAWVGETDVAAANHLCATWPLAPFPNHLMLGAYRSDARLGLFDRNLTVERAGSITRREIVELADFADTLVRGFGLGLDHGTVARLWSKVAPADATAV